MVVSPRVTEALVSIVKEFAVHVIDNQGEIVIA